MAISLLHFTDGYPVKNGENSSAIIKELIDRFGNIAELLDWGEHILEHPVFENDGFKHTLEVHQNGTGMYHRVPLRASYKKEVEQDAERHAEISERCLFMAFGRHNRSEGVTYIYRIIIFEDRTGLN